MMSKEPSQEQENKQKVIKSQFQEAFEAFTPVPTLEEIQTEVRKLINLYQASLSTKAMAYLIHNCIDLTTLNATDHTDHIFHFVNKVNDLDAKDPTIPPVASICVYPRFVSVVKEFLAVEGVGITAVTGGFPASQTFPEIKIAETNLALLDGATEIDVVLSVGDFLAGDYEAVVDELKELRDITEKQNATYKVILETGALKKADNIQRASILALFSGADFIKTSTGKEYPGASLTDVYIMAKVLKEFYNHYGEKKGLKISGGVRTLDEAIQYLCIVKGVLGDEWFTNQLLRFGASSLEGDVLKALK